MTSETIASAIVRDRPHWLAVAQEADGVADLAEEMKDFYRCRFKMFCDHADTPVDTYDWREAAEELLRECNKCSMVQQGLIEPTQRDVGVIGHGERSRSIKLDHL